MLVKHTFPIYDLLPASGHIQFSNLYEQYLFGRSMCVEHPVYIQSEQNGSSSIPELGAYYNHINDVTLLSVKFVITASATR